MKERKRMSPRGPVTGTRRPGSDRQPDRSDISGYLLVAGAEGRDRDQERDPERARWHPGALFDAPAPVELEIGCGKGAFLVLAATEHPDVNFVGVELALPFARVAADRLARRGLINARVLVADAGWLVRDRIATDCLAAVHVFFPDPWPKRRHHKRRLFAPTFVDGVARVLEPDGMLCLATDHVETYALMRRLLDPDGRFERVVSYVWHGVGGITNFERKYLREGRASFRVSYRKRSVEREWRRL